MFNTSLKLLIGCLGDWVHVFLNTISESNVKYINFYFVAAGVFLVQQLSAGIKDIHKNKNAQTLMAVSHFVVQAAMAQWLRQ